MSSTVSSLHEHENVIDWLNESLDKANSSDLTALDQHIGQLLASLEISSQDCSAEVERIIDQVSHGVPRLTYDLHYMRDGALSLQSALSAVQTNTKDAVPDPTLAALDRLQHLDLVKGRMEAAREVLREAESWSSLEMEVISLLAENNYEKAAERLGEASKVCK